MRDKQTEKIVRICSTGHAEGDMLGQVYMYLAERTNRGLSQRPHRKKLKGYTFLSRSEVSKLIQSGTQTSLLRRICALPGKGYRMVRGYISSMRKNKRNGN